MKIFSLKNIVVALIVASMTALLCVCVSAYSAGSAGKPVQVSATMKPAPTPIATLEPTATPKVTESLKPTEPSAEDETAAEGGVQDKISPDNNTLLSTTVKSGNTPTGTSSGRGSAAQTAVPENSDNWEVVVCGSEAEPENPGNWDVPVCGSEADPDNPDNWEVVECH